MGGGGELAEDLHGNATRQRRRPAQHGDDRHAARRQPLDQGAADESSGAGDHDRARRHSLSLPVPSPATITVRPAISYAARGLSRGGAHAKQRAAPPGRTAAERTVSRGPQEPLDLEALRRRFVAREANVGIIGLGYVGLPLVGAIAGAGFRVVGFDVDAEKVALLNAGRSYIRHIPDAAIAALVRSRRFRAVADFAEIAAGRRRADLRADAAHPPPRARSLLSSSAPPRRSRRICAAASSSCWNRRHIPAPRASVMLPILERGGLEIRRRFLPGLFARARGSRQRAVQHHQDPQGGGRRRRCGAGAGGRALRPVRRRHRPGLLARDRGGGEAHREHLPRRQHRARQRAEDGLRGAWASTSGR